MNDQFLNEKLSQRRSVDALRNLRLAGGKSDFCSNDYLGIATNDLIKVPPGFKHGSTGSRLLAGNYALIELVENEIAAFHEAPAGLIYNSGYDANLGLLSCVPQKQDTIIYDNLSHASLRDGARLSFARSFSYAHNDLEDLTAKLAFASMGNGNIFVVTESVFSMDGDLAPLAEICGLCKKYNAFLIVDEAHATGVIGKKGEGMVQKLQLTKESFARIHTFGKGCGVHGAIVLGSEKLKEYLINFSRSFIYTTALPEHDVAAIQESYRLFPLMTSEREKLQEYIALFQDAQLPFTRLTGQTPIQVIVIPGNAEVKRVAAKMQESNLDVRAILYPTVPKGSERLRIVLHSFNTFEEINLLISSLQH